MTANAGEARIRHSPAAAKGREMYLQIWTHVNELRRLGREPKCVWVGQDAANYMHQLWWETTRSYDGILPAVTAGVPVKVGMTGGKDYLVEFYEDVATNEAARNASTFNPDYNPLYGTH